MSKELFENLNTASILLGIIAVIAALNGDLPAPYAVVIAYMVPMIVFTNYFVLEYLAEKTKTK